MELDESDRRILRVIQDRPEVTMRELGEATGMSHSPCWRRLQRLQDEGAVSARRYVIDPESVGYEILVFCFVKISHHQRERLKAFEDAVANVPEILLPRVVYSCNKISDFVDCYKKDSLCSLCNF